VIPPVDLVVPVKALHLAKSRLRAGRTGPEPAHRRLVLAVTLDTIAAAAAAPGVRRVLAVCSDPAATAVLRAEGVEIAADEPDAGLNPALRHGAALLRAADPGAVTGALQADLPALRPAELSAAVALALTMFSGAGCAVRVFCPDRTGTGTTLLLAAPGTALDPRFGAGSAGAHAASGAARLNGPWPSLRCDVDTEADLAEAARLGLGRHTAALTLSQAG
jgi:2-phospho-L-lactate guanylyltransferase